MTTIPELKKYAKSHGFVSSMNSLGFELSPSGFWFYRLRAGFIDYIGFHLKSSKCYLTVPVTCLKYDLMEHSDMSKFPKGFEKEMPFYSSTYINEEYGVEIGGDPWKVEKESDVENTFIELFKLIDSSADSWLKGIDTDSKLYDSFTINFKESDKAKRLKKILVG